MQNYLIIIAGPTAVGKTAAAIEVAKHFNSEIISADSRQIYQELNIGVARPSAEELHAVKHYFIANKSIHKHFSAGDYEREVIELLEKLFVDNNNIVVMSGGTGLYINAVCNGFDAMPDIDLNIREQLNERYHTEGIVPLQNKLEELDPETYQSIDINNTQRVIRALEVSMSTGLPISSFKNKKEIKRNFQSIKICLNVPREQLYEQINKRVDHMIDNELLEEAQTVYPFKKNNALQTVGYKELFQYFENNCTLENAIQQIKQHTRNYAKRQLTWFRKDTDYKWFEPQQLNDIIRYIEGIISNSR